MTSKSEHPIEWELSPDSIQTITAQFRILSPEPSIGCTGHGVDDITLHDDNGERLTGLENSLTAADWSAIERTILDEYDFGGEDDLADRRYDESRDERI